MNKERKRLSTAIINSRILQEDVHRSINMPIYSGAAFEFDSAEEMEAAFLGKSGKHTYTRISNPTVDFFEQRIKAASEAMEVTALASGMAAISNIFMTIGYAGANIVTSAHLFGNTFSFFRVTLQAFGIEVRFCNLLDTNDVEKHIDENTCAVFTEIITNPHMEVADIRSLVGIAKKKKVPLIADTTLIPWCAFKARHFGADIEIVSSTKYISGGATSVGGLIIDHGTFDWTNSPKLKKLAETTGNKAFHVKLRGEIFRNLGACMAPQVAYLQNTGLETVELRFERSSSTSLELARFLETVPSVKNVNYPGLFSSPYYEISKAQFGEYPGAMLTFELADRKACFAFMNKLKVIRRSTNLFDNKSLIIHPSSTIYGLFSPEYKALVDVPDNMLRLSVGLEDIQDLKEDLES